MGSPGGSDGKECSCDAGDPLLIPGWEDPLEKGVATHSSILAWTIPWTELPGWPQSTGLQSVGHTEQLTFSLHFSFSYVQDFQIPISTAGNKLIYLAT